MNTFSIVIFDQKGKQISEMLTATPTQILKFLNKGFKVVDRATGQDLTVAVITSMIGVSDSVISC